jgi:hypothetical protein
MVATVELFGMPAAQALVAGVLLLAAVVVAGIAAWKRWANGLLGDVFGDAPRGADDPAPAGVQEYARDLEQACEGAGAEFLWSAVKACRTRDQARADWIAELLQREKF